MMKIKAIIIPSRAPLKGNTFEKNEKNEIVLKILQKKLDKKLHIC